jgi:hypothetical protein
MSYCLPKEFAAKFLKALQDGTIDTDALASMKSSAERRAVFERVVGKEDAPHVTALFESKLLLKDQQRGLESWVRSLVGVKAAVRRDMLAKVARLDKVLTPSDEHGFLADLAEQKLGTAVTEDEAKNITGLAKAAQKARDNPGSNMSGVSDEYLKASEGLKHYVDSLKPTTAMASIGRNLLVAGRNHMLMNPSTPIKTTVGQVLNSTTERLGRRLSTLSLNGISADVAAQANAEAWRTFRATGRNTAAMESIDDAGIMGEKSNFKMPEGMSDTHGAIQAVEKGVRWYAGKTNKIAIDIEHNITFTKFYQRAFFDGANIGATNLAKSEGLSGAPLKSRSDAIVRDAARIEPQTDEGTTIRKAAQMQAARVTSTNETWLSGLVMGIKKAINDKVPGLGDIIAPIAKIPATIIANGIDIAGPGLPLGVKDMFQGSAKMRAEDAKTKYEGAAQFRDGIMRLVRTFGGLGMAALITSELHKKDFRSDNFGNHYVQIGGVWINTEYFASFAPALSAMMYVRQFGRATDSLGQTAGHYVSGAAQGLKNAPVINELTKLVSSVVQKDAVDGAMAYGQTFLKSRGLPAAVQNITRDRPGNRLFFGAHGVETQAEVNKDKRQADLRRAASRRAHSH